MQPPRSSRNSQLRIAVIGGGVIGLACAFEMGARGAHVAVYERGPELGAGATVRSAGMLGAAFDWELEQDEAPLARLAQRAGGLWPNFVERLVAEVGGEVELSGEGTLAAARTAAEVEWIEALAAACQARGLEAYRLSAEELKRREPALTGEVRAGLLSPGDRQVDPQKLLLRLGAALSQSGVGLKMGRSVDWIEVGAEFVLPDGERFDRIVLATGVASVDVRFVGRQGDALATGLADIVPVKGQMLALAPVEDGPRHVIHARDVYIAPKSKWVLVGATVERGKSDTSVDRTAIEALRAQAAQLVGALRHAPEAAAWAGVRPGTPDDAPMIGESAIPGVFAALGMYRNGVLFAPAVAELVADMVVEGKVSIGAAAFAPGRFDTTAKAPHSR